MLHETTTKEALKGSYFQRWAILQAIYSAYIDALDYTPIGWRESEEIPQF